LSPAKNTVLMRMLLAAVVAGTLDIGAAALINGVNPVTILGGIATVAFPSAPLAGDVLCPVIGLLVQWALSFIIAAIGIGGALRYRELQARWVVTGLLYGVVIFGVMNYLVLPLSRVGHAPHFRPFKFVANLVAMLVFGLIVMAFAKLSVAEQKAPMR
jgi:hypothetical protein